MKTGQSTEYLQPSNYEMRDLKVEITQVVEHDGEYDSELAASEADADVKGTPVSLTRADLRAVPLDLEAGSYEQGKAVDRSFAV